MESFEALGFVDVMCEICLRDILDYNQLRAYVWPSLFIAGPGGDA